MRKRVVILMTYLKTAFEYLKRNMWSSLSSLLVMTLTFFLLSIFSLAAWGSNLVLAQLEMRPQITAYFKDSATEGEILGIADRLEKTGLAAKVDYVSKEEALDVFIGLSQDNPALLEGISANVLPASLEVQAKKIGDLPVLAKSLESEPLLEDLQFYKDVVEKFRNLVKTSRILGLGLIFILAAISVLIVLSTIGSTITARGKEIEIMRLVGAGNRQIRTPFLVQGAILGIAAAVLAVLVTFLLLPLLLPYVAQALAGLSVPSISPLLLVYLFVGEAVLGGLLGSLGSWVAVRKYLKV